MAITNGPAPIRGPGPATGGSFSTFYLSGGPSTPLVETAAEGNTTLDQKQAAAVLGTPVPIVFCRRVTRGGITSGGVLISPPATECRFENDTSNTLTAYYRLLLSEGRLAGVQIRDVFQVSCRGGSHAQAYNGKAGSWIAGNAMVDRAGYTEQECPTVCGGGGSYLDISSLSFQCSYPNGDTTWDRQVHVFIRNGIEVSRLLDGVTGPSNNLADLMVLALKRSSRVPTRLIDTTSLLAAAKFLDVNGLWFDCIIKESHNLEDYIYELAPFFLLRPTKSNGKYGLKPLLPTTSTGAINTATIDWSWQFTENDLLDRFEIDWVPLADRRPYCSVMTWRQQPDDDLGLIRTVEYRSNRLAENGPYESSDLSAFCTTENHAVKVAAYNQARRSYVTHTLGITLKPGPWSADLSQGDIVRVTVPRRTTGEGTTWHDYLYEVGEVLYGNDGEIGLSLIHFPVDSTGKSIVALAVANAVGTGTLLSTGRTGPSCDTNSSSSTSALSVATGQGEGNYDEQNVNNENEQQEGDPGGTDEDPTDVKDGGGSGSNGGNYGRDIDNLENTEPGAINVPRSFGGVLTFVRIVNNGEPEYATLVLASNESMGNLVITGLSVHWQDGRPDSDVGPGIAVSTLGSVTVNVSNLTTGALSRVVQLFGGGGGVGYTSGPLVQPVDAVTIKMLGGAQGSSELARFKI